MPQKGSKKKTAPEDPPSEGVEQQEIVTDGGSRGTPELTSEHRKMQPDDEPVEVMSAGFQRLNILESIAKRSAEITESEYDENDQVYTESDFTETHGPAGVTAKGPAKPAGPAAPKPGEPTPETTPGTVPPADKTPKPAASATVKDPTPATPAPADQKIKIVVDGVEEEITMQEAVRRLQIGGSAEKRLQDATTALKRVQALEERLGVEPGSPNLRVVEGEGAGAGTSRPGPHQGPGAAIPQEVIKTVDNIIEGIRYGDETESRNAMFALFQMGMGGPGSNISTVVRTELDKTEIDRRFRNPPDKGGFGDIVADPDLFDLMVRRVDRATTPTRMGGEGKDGRKWETYEEIGNDIRSKYLSGAGNGATSFQAKETEKAEAEVIPPTVTIAPAPGGGQATAPFENPNPSTTIADMARARRVGA